MIWNIKFGISSRNFFRILTGVAWHNVAGEFYCVHHAARNGQLAKSRQSAYQVAQAQSVASNRPIREMSS
jgi:hypothetical protein